jgi:hypothetical protein
MILDLQPILACPQCTYDRFMPTWVAFASIRLLVVCLVAYRRLDVVRVLGLFTAFELAYLYLWRFGNWYGHPGVAGEAINGASMIFVLLLISGIPAALVMKHASRYAYFQIPSHPPFTWKRALLLVPFLFGLAIFETQRAFSHSSFGPH